VTLEAEPVSPGEALSGKLSGKLFDADYLRNSTRYRHNATKY